jgi:hypothetical protein
VRGAVEVRCNGAIATPRHLASTAGYNAGSAESRPIHLRFGRTVISEIEAPNILVHLV